MLTPPWSALFVRWKSTNGSAVRKGAVWTMLLDASSTAPPASASGQRHPVFLEEAKVHPDRPAELGAARLMNLIAVCSRTHGSNGSRITTPPRIDTPEPTSATCARMSVRTSQAGFARAHFVGDRPEPDVGQLADQQIRGDDQTRRSAGGPGAGRDGAGRRIRRILAYGGGGALP